ncbi:MAG: hypothetical protein JWP97_4303 [Labilithrix sp.]|nr:hypothetical protein [Labilithrix sp.]
MNDLRRLAVLAMTCVALAACGRPAAPPPEEPTSLSFRPTVAGERMWLATPFAVELLTERDARIVEMADAAYIGEVDVRGGARPRSSVLALLAAEWGATHFRVTTSAAGRVDVVLYRVEPNRWRHLPTAMQPTQPATAAAVSIR